MIMIVASSIGLDLQEVVVAPGTKEYIDIQKKSLGSFPVLEVTGDVYICDSFAIASHLVRESGNKGMIGNNDFQEAEVA